MTTWITSRENEHTPLSLYSFISLTLSLSLSLSLPFSLSLSPFLSLYLSLSLFLPVSVRAGAQSPNLLAHTKHHAGIIPGSDIVT